MLRVLPWICLFVAGCEEGADGQPFVDLGDPQDWIDPVEYHLASTTTAAWMSAIAVEHWTHGSHPCATEDADGVLTLAPGPDCVHPLLEDLEGTATLQRPDIGAFEFSADASGLSVGGRGLLATDYASIQAAPAGNAITLGISTADYGAPTQWIWVIQVDTAGTPETGDDSVAIDGLGTAPEPLPGRYQVGDNEVAMTSSLATTPGCRSNPTSGSVIMEGHSDYPLLEILAHAQCDGRVQIDSNEQEAEWTPKLDLLAGQ